MKWILSVTCFCSLYLWAIPFFVLQWEGNMAMPLWSKYVPPCYWWIWFCNQGPPSAFFSICILRRMYQRIWGKKSRGLKSLHSKFIRSKWVYWQVHRTTNFQLAFFFFLVLQSGNLKNLNVLLFCFKIVLGVTCDHFGYMLSVDTLHQSVEKAAHIPNLNLVLPWVWCGNASHFATLIFRLMTVLSFW